MYIPSYWRVCYHMYDIQTNKLNYTKISSILDVTLCCLIRPPVVSKESIVFNCKVSRPKVHRPFNLEEDSKKFFRNARHHLSSDAASHRRRLDHQLHSCENLKTLLKSFITRSNIKRHWIRRRYIRGGPIQIFKRHWNGWAYCVKVNHVRSFSITRQVFDGVYLWEISGVFPWRLLLTLFYYIGQCPIPEIYFQRMAFLDLAVFPPSVDCHSTHRFIMRSDASRGPRRLIIRELFLNIVQINISRPIMTGKFTGDDHCH
jgi:hypothetical protein